MGTLSSEIINDHYPPMNFPPLRPKKKVICNILSPKFLFLPNGKVRPLKEGQCAAMSASVSICPVDYQLLVRLHRGCVVLMEWMDKYTAFKITMCFLHELTSLTFTLLWVLIITISILYRRKLSVIELNHLPKCSLSMKDRDRTSSSDSKSRGQNLPRGEKRKIPVHYLTESLKLMNLRWVMAWVLKTGFSL